MLKFWALTVLSVVAGQTPKTIHVSTLSGLVKGMEDPAVGRIFIDKSIALAGEPLPTIQGRTFEIDADPTCGPPCVLDAQHRTRIFNIGGSGSGLSLGGLTLKNAAATSGNGSAVFIAPGGGMLSAGDMRFVNNTNMEGYGGAIWGGVHSLLSFNGCQMLGNIAANGGVIASYGGGISIGHSIFHNNKASEAGGAIFLEGGNVTLSLSHSTLLQNDAGSGGGGAIVLGANANRTLKSLGKATAGISNVTFQSNSAAGPGGAMHAGAFGNIALGGHSVFIANEAVGRGGAIATETANAMAMANTTFVRNRVKQDSVGKGQGGAAICIGSEPDFLGPVPTASVFNNITMRDNVVRKADVTAVASPRGAGFLFNEGEAILNDLCHFSENRNMNLKAAKDEQDACTFGRSSEVIFKTLEPVTCDSCGGTGQCHIFPGNEVLV